MSASDAVGMDLIYRVEIGEPGTGGVWWKVSNVGSPRQVVAALTELAVRVERDIRAALDSGRRRYGYELAWSDGVVLESFRGEVESVLIPGELRGLAVTLASCDDSPG
ncbi:hypothetical protein [Nocardia sp. NBC_01009]|uniref:hypothetical protein n=1 Tax=Nocardia sp. NBC_01009 TaxID=2975996 RepID=UPI00386F24D8|nr:hypothetical protein OHA42_18345 [Nocardia sp. NBC_01009]